MAEVDNAIQVMSNTVAEPEEEEDGDEDEDTPADPKISGNLTRKYDERDAMDDYRLKLVAELLRDQEKPQDMEIPEWTRLVSYAQRFFLDNERLWRRHKTGENKIVVEPEDRLQLIEHAHDDAGHRGVFATSALLKRRFWWPRMDKTIAWYVQSCHSCQVRQIRQILIPPVVAQPSPLFAKVYIDTMHLRISSGKKYIVQARCSLSHYPEFVALGTENAPGIGKWIFQDLLCRWGGLAEIVTDNGTPFVKAMEFIEKKYGVRHIRISGYNSRANGIVERPHYDVRNALWKAANGDPSQWYQNLSTVFWAERITVRKRMGCSPYYAVPRAKYHAFYDRFHHQPSHSTPEKTS